MLAHDALLYASDEELLATVVPFAAEGITQDEAVVAVTTDRNISLLQDALGADAQRVEFIRSDDWYRHPMRTIAGYGRTLDDRLAGGHPRVRVIGEVQFGATEVEQREWVRYEAALNTVFADRSAWIVCPYDERSLPPWIVAHAVRTHPHLLHERSRPPSGMYTDPHDAARTLPPAPPLGGRPVVDMEITRDLAAARRTIREVGARAGLDGEAVDELAVALTEALTNALVHGRPPVRLRVYRDETTVTCELSDSGGAFAEPLAGFAPAPAGAEGGRGLWLVRHLCDHVEFLPDDGRTVLRMAKSLTG